MYLMSFSHCRGQPLELPEHYVPSAYREWDVHLFDWQTQCSTKAVHGEGLKVGLKRLMPTVGVRNTLATLCKGVLRPLLRGFRNLYVAFLCLMLQSFLVNISVYGQPCTMVSRTQSAASLQRP